MALHKAETDELLEQGIPAEQVNQAAANLYAPAFLTCPATLAVDAAQTEHRKGHADEQARKAGLEPERARSWITIREGEQPPTFDD